MIFGLKSSQARILTSRPYIQVSGFFFIIGKACIGNGLAEPDGVCAPGYYCIQSALRVDPVDGITGDECPIGSYCPGNTSTHLPCEPGSYR